MAAFLISIPDQADAMSLSTVLAMMDEAEKIVAKDPRVWNLSLSLQRASDFGFYRFVFRFEVVCANGPNVRLSVCSRIFRQGDPQGAILHALAETDVLCSRKIAVASGAPAVGAKSQRHIATVDNYRVVRID